MLFRIILICTLSLSTLYSAESFSVSNPQLVRMVFTNQYEYLGNNTFANIALVDRNFYQQALLAANSYYSIHDEKQQNTGCVTLICTACLKETCDHKTRKYRGLFSRTTPDKSCFKAYLISPYINHIAKLYSQCNEWKSFINPQPSINLPLSTVPNNSRHYSYHGITAPYFALSDNIDHISILQAIPVLKSNTASHLYYIPNIGTIHECALFNFGACRYSPVYFKHNATSYPLGLLTLLPALFDTYISQIGTRQIIGETIDTKTTFETFDFYKKYLPEKNTPDILHNLFQTITAITRTNNLSNRYENRSLCELLKHHYDCPNEYDANLRKSDSTDWVKFAVCAKLTGNNRLALACLHIYDYIEKQPLHNYCQNIYIHPFGGITIYRDTAVESDYYSVLENLNKFSTIEQVIKNAKERKQYIVISPAAFIEIQKNNNNLTIYPWVKDGQYRFQQCKKFTITNCTGKIHTPLFPPNYKHIDDITYITITETGTNKGNSYSRIHKLDANQVTNADDRNTPTPISANPTTPTTTVTTECNYMQHANPLIARILNQTSNRENELTEDEVRSIQLLSQEEASYIRNNSVYLLTPTSWSSKFYNSLRAFYDYGYIYQYNEHHLPGVWLQDCVAILGCLYPYTLPKIVRIVSIGTTIRFFIRRAFTANNELQYHVPSKLEKYYCNSVIIQTSFFSWSILHLFGYSDKLCILGALVPLLCTTYEALRMFNVSSDFRRYIVCPYEQIWNTTEAQFYRWYKSKSANI